MQRAVKVIKLIKVTRPCFCSGATTSAGNLWQFGKFQPWKFSSSVWCFGAKHRVHSTFSGWEALWKRQCEGTRWYFTGKYAQIAPNLCKACLSHCFLCCPEILYTARKPCIVLKQHVGESTPFDLKMAKPSITHNSPLCLLLLNHMQMKAGGFNATRFNSTDKRVDSVFCFHGGKDRLQQLIHHTCHCFQFNFLFSQSALFLDECRGRYVVTFTVRRNYSWHSGNKLIFQLHKLHIKAHCQALTCRFELVLHHPDIHDASAWID